MRRTRYYSRSYRKFVFEALHIEKKSKNLNFLKCLEIYKVSKDDITLSNTLEVNNYLPLLNLL